MERLKAYLSSRGAPDQFTTFAILYMIPMVHELGDPWWSWGGRHAPLMLQGLILVLITTIALYPGPATFLGFAALSAAYYILTSFPEIPNHITLLVYCNLVVMISFPYLSLRKPAVRTNEAIFTQVRPVLRLILMALFFTAGFHKLNTDFLDPEVSCVNFVLGLLEGRVFSNIFGIPFIVLVAPLVAASAYWMFRKLARSGARLAAPGVAIVAMLAFVLVGGMLLSGGDPGSIVVGAGAIMMLLWQLVEGPLLFVRRLQAPILLISILLLGTIAVSGVPMFPAVLLPLLFVFIPDHVYGWWRDRSRLQIGQWRIHSIYVCLFMNLLGASLVYVNQATDPTYEAKVLVLAVSQALFLGGVLLLLVPLISRLLSGGREWGGVKVWDGGTPPLFLLFPLILLLWGMTPYLGLRTAGNFSMFSNLKTEDAESNHLLLSGNPLKFWDYQEDRVRIIEVDDDRAKIGHHFDPLEGNSVPVVEFRKMVTMWREAGTELAMTYAYGGDIVHAGDIVRDDRWAGAGRNWESFWLDFRPVQEAGPNRCRW